MIVISFNSVIFMLNNYIAKHIGYWYWVLVLPGTNNIGYWVLGGFLGIVLTLWRIQGGQYGHVPPPIRPWHTLWSIDSQEN